MDAQTPIHRVRARRGGFATLVALSAIAFLPAVAQAGTAPIASFSSSPAKPLAGDTVTFTSTSTAGSAPIYVQGYDLDGDGGFETMGPTATKQFDSAGSYTVRFALLDRAGRWDIETRTIEVYDPPTASFASSPATPESGKPITFTSTSTANGDGATISSQAWDLNGDGSYGDGSLKTATTSFSAGPHEIGLKVTDSNGITDTVRRTVTVYAPPSASFDIPSGTLESGTSLGFSSTSGAGSGATIASQSWDLNGDGVYAEGSAKTASKAFAAGTYTVGLRVTDSRGLSDTVQRTIVVYDAPHASFDVSPATLETGKPVSFGSTSTQSGSGVTVASQAWDLNGDGVYGEGSGAGATKTFATAGTYTVGLKVVNSKGLDATVQRTVVVYDAPHASLAASPATPESGKPVTLSSTSSASPGATIASQAWDLNGDGVYAEGSAATAAKTFSAGTYTVGLKVTDTRGLTDTVQRAVTVYAPPTASFDIPSGTLETNKPLTFSSTSGASAGATIASQSWDLNGDGVYGEGSAKTASRTFAGAGTYTVGLKVVDSRGLEDTVQRTIVVYNPPHASFDVSPATLESGKPVTFTSTSTQSGSGVTVASQGWDLNDDGVYAEGSGTSATKTFATAGTYTVGIRVVNSKGLDDTEHRTIVVYDAPHASFDIAPSTLADGKPVTFSSTSTQSGNGVTITSQSWDLDGDGTYGDATGGNATQSFSAGSHSAALKVTNSKGLESTVRRTFVVYAPPTAAFDFAPAAPTAGQDVTFTSTATDSDGHVDLQSWDLDGDGHFGDAIGATATQAFSEGSHSVRLRVTDSQGLVDEVERTLDVGPAPVVAGSASETPVSFETVSGAAPSAIAPPSTGLSWISPFPIVRVAGSAGRNATRIRVFTVLSPLGTNVRVTCAGRSCPRKAMSRRVSGRQSTALVHLRAFERSYRAGARIKISVTLAGLVGKYTQLTVRRLKPPSRLDACLVPGHPRPMRCPAKP